MFETAESIRAVFIAASQAGDAFAAPGVELASTVIHLVGNGAPKFQFAQQQYSGAEGETLLVPIIRSNSFNTNESVKVW